MSALQDAGVALTGYQWVYSPGIARNEFPPHRALAGVFVDFMPTSEGWYPGDHKGCMCSTRLILRGPDGRFLPAEILNPPNALGAG
jgi:hypothetical protein